MKFDFIRASYSVVGLVGLTRKRNVSYKYPNINIVSGSYYELVTNVGNEYYEHFIIPLDHIYFTIEAYTKALLARNSIKYGKPVTLVTFEEMTRTTLPVYLYRVGGF